jgi:glycosyltransferase involved in cell wall biosynthesis
MNKTKTISVVIPVLNEEKSLVNLYSGIKSALDKLKKDYELIFVDDGSTDNSFFVLKKIYIKNKKKVKLIKLRKRFGKGAALSCGFDHSKGDCVITIDSDLQDDPNEIPRLIAKLDEGYDVVTGWKAKRKDAFFKKMFSYFFNVLTSLVMGLRVHDINCGIKAYRKNVLIEIDLYGDFYRFIPLLAYRKGFKVCEIPVKHHPRKYGKSKYGWKRLIGGGLDLLTIFFITHYQSKPSHFFGVMGLLLFLIGFVIDLYLTAVRIVTGTFQGHIPLLLFGMLLIIVGVQLISLGLLGELYLINVKKKEYSVEYSTYKNKYKG